MYLAEVCFQLRENEEIIGFRVAKVSKLATFQVMNHRGELSREHRCDFEFQLW